MTLKTIILIFLLTQSFANALKCKRCRGKTCDGIIPVEDCEIQPKTLPYNFEDSLNGEEDETKACVELLYVKKNSKFAVMQCIANSNNLCDRISTSLPPKVFLEKCKVQSEVGYEYLDVEEGGESTTDWTTNPTTVSVHETTAASTTASSNKPTTIPTTNPSTLPTTTVLTTNPTTLSTTVISTNPTTETESSMTSTEYPTEVTTEGNSNIAVLSLFALITSIVIHKMSYYEKEQARLLQLLAEYEAEEEDGGELLSLEESDADENVSEQDVQCDMDIEEEIDMDFDALYTTGDGLLSKWENKRVHILQFLTSENIVKGVLDYTQKHEVDETKGCQALEEHLTDLQTRKLSVQPFLLLVGDDLTYIF
ncbi:hypothetical protein RN001_013416 [Aquatica leii]|uniref:Uncharacterized protein n=1 Tax=Aquatica leii TaxID=1421715 RepID=A0AAN7P4E8_9COLE|nr:hypothetical protein RN001_013416 [Aquatica leii]